jgi:hypothetical protein
MSENQDALSLKTVKQIIHVSAIGILPTMERAAQAAEALAEHGSELSDAISLTNHLAQGLLPSQEKCLHAALQVEQLINRLRHNQIDVAARPRH